MEDVAVEEPSGTGARALAILRSSAPGVMSSCSTVLEVAVVGVSATGGEEAFVNGELALDEPCWLFLRFPWFFLLFLFFGGILPDFPCLQVRLRFQFPSFLNIWRKVCIIGAS